VSHGTEDSTERIGRIPLRQILSLDKRAFEADRSKLLRRLYRELPKRWSWVTNIAGISGYSLVKQYQDSSEIGPLICEDMNQESIGKLLSSSVALTDKWPLEMTVPESNSSIIEAAARHGFRVERKGFVMSYVGLRPIAIAASVGAFGFLDKG
jgi:nitrate reductase NapE component